MVRREPLTLAARVAAVGGLTMMAALFPLLAAVGAAAVPMAFPGADWEEAPSESQGVDSAKLQAAMDYLRANSGRDGVREVVVVRNGILIWKGDNIDHQHGIWSMTKSFTSTVLGLLVDDGKAALETRACEVVPALAATTPGITLRHFATMTSGYRAVGDEPMGKYVHGPSRTPFAPDATPLFAPPGSQYAYWDSAMNQFGSVLTRIAAEPIEDLFRRRVADPIGMDRAKWRWGNLGQVDGRTVNGGSGNHNQHLFITAREVARFGHLFLNRGNWKGKQLVSAAWADAATSVQVPATLPLHPSSGADGRGVYGFNWWVNGVKADGTRKFPDAPAGTFSASGANNNDLFVIPEWRMVVVRLGLDEFNDGKIADETYSTWLGRIGNAVRE